MLSIYDLKPKFQSRLRPLVGKAAARGITPNQITSAALSLSLVTGCLVWFSHGALGILLLVPAVLFIRMALNAMDGMLAREHNLTSRAGQVLNEGGDIVSDIALYLPFAVIPGVMPPLMVFTVIAAILTECAGILAQAMTGTRRYDGPMGKSDRALFFGALAILLAFQILAPVWINLLVLIAFAMSVWTIANRLRPLLKETI